MKKGNSVGIQKMLQKIVLKLFFNFWRQPSNYRPILDSNKWHLKLNSTTLWYSSWLRMKRFAHFSNLSWPKEQIHGLKNQNYLIRKFIGKELNYIWSWSKSKIILMVSFEVIDNSKWCSQRVRTMTMISFMKKKSNNKKNKSKNNNKKKRKDFDHSHLS